MHPPVRELELKTPGGVLRGITNGNTAGHSLLALHGWQDNAGTFLPLLPHFSAFHFVAIDLPGHGWSDWRQDSDYAFYRWVLDGFAAADALHWESFSLLGHSMGAGISSLMAGANPERIQKLALIEGLGPLSTPPDKAPGLFRDRFAALAKGKMAAFRPVSSMEDAITRRVGPGKLLETESARILMKRGLRETPTGLKFSHDPLLRLPSAVRFSEEHVLAFLKEIQAPTVLIRARSGWPVDAEKMRVRIDAVSNCELVEVEGKHHVHLDAPLSVASTLLKHLSP